MLLAVAVALSGPSASRQVDGVWVWPLDPVPTVLRGFEPPPEPWLAGHRGVDLAAQPGQAVRAAGTGVVVFAGMVAGRPVISISHGALRTTYEPVDPVVTAGDTVQAEAVIGTVSGLARHCGTGRTCLHWGLRRGEDYLDPLALLGRAPIRLLPVWTSPPAGPMMPARPLARTVDRRQIGATAVATTAATLALGTLGGLALAIHRRRI